MTEVGTQACVSGDKEVALDWLSLLFIQQKSNLCSSAPFVNEIGL